MTNIVKLHAAGASATEHLDTLVIKPIFKCTPQIKIIKERLVLTKRTLLKLNYSQVSTFKTYFLVSQYLWNCVILHACIGCISATSSKVGFFLTTSIDRDRYEKIKIMITLQIHCGSLWDDGLVVWRPPLTIPQHLICLG